MYKTKITCALAMILAVTGCAIPEQPAAANNKIVTTSKSQPTLDDVLSRGMDRLAARRALRSRVCNVGVPGGFFYVAGCDSPLFPNKVVVLHFRPPGRTSPDYTLDNWWFEAVENWPILYLKPGTRCGMCEYGPGE